MTHGIDVYDFVHGVEEETEDGEYPFISPNYLGSKMGLRTGTYF